MAAKKPKSSVDAAKTLANFCGIGERTAARWLAADCPRPTAGRIDYRATLKWLAKYRPSRLDDSAKEKLDIERARIFELKRMRMEGELAPVGELQLDLRRMVDHLRQAGETIGRLYGWEATEILNSALFECESVINAMPDRQREPSTPDEPKRGRRRMAAAAG
jgi:hypothetical protein